MKRKLLKGMGLWVLAFCSWSCEYNEPEFGARLEVLVKNETGVPQAGRTVYLYVADAVSEERIDTPMPIQLATNDYGAVTFHVNFTSLRIGEKEAEVYISVLEIEGDVRSSLETEHTTLRLGEAKKINFTVPD